MSYPVIRTERLELRKPTPRDAKTIARLCNQENYSRVMRIPWPYRLKDANDFITHVRKSFGKTDYAYMLHLDKNMIGGVGLHLETRDNKGEIGFWVRKRYRRNGYATEAVSALLSFAFKVLGLNRVEVNHVKNNKASESMIRKLGFVKEGIQRRGIRTGDGKYKDRVDYGLLRGEWKR